MMILMLKTIKKILEIMLMIKWVMYEKIVDSNKNIITI